LRFKAFARVLVAVAGAGVVFVERASPPATIPVTAIMAANGDEWFELQRAYPSSKPAPADALQKAMTSWRGGTDRSPRPKLAITGDRWISIGPQPIGVSNGLTYAGRITTVAPHPTNANILYVGTDFGVYVSTNGGQRWEVLGGNLPSVQVSDLQYHARDRLIIVSTYGRGVWAMDTTRMTK